MTETKDFHYINTIRGLAVDVVQGADSGHPGMPLGMAPVMHILQSEFLKYNPKNSKWFDRDRFVLSNGHGCALLYTMLHLCGYGLPMDELKRFRQLHARTPGHPERHMTDGIEVTTGPLGQGVANAVGLALAESHLAARFNKPGHIVIDHYTYAFCGDGCLMEGICQEGLSLAGHFGLEKLIIIYDDNHISIDGDTALSFTECSVKKYEAIGFHCIVVKDGNTDLGAIRAAIEEAKSIKGKPKMIHLRTTIGFGAPNEGSSKVHGAPLGAEGVKSLKVKLGLDPSKQYNVPEDVYSFYAEVAKKGASKEAEWNQTMQKYMEAFPIESAELKAFIAGELPASWADQLPKNSDKAIATRKASENVLASLVPSVKNIIGGSADLTGSNLTKVEGHIGYQKDTPHGRYIYFGVREHAMAAICNGIEAHGGCISYCGTFLNFIGYALGAVRLSALSKLGVIYVATHDGIGLGEDGPTHQPLELAPILRATPNLYLFRPADQTETTASWVIAVESRTTPSVLALTRQALKPLVNSSLEGVRHGAYTVFVTNDAQRKENKPELILIGTGSEVSLCVEAAHDLSQEGMHVHVVSMPCTALFDAQTQSYKDTVLIPGVPVLSVEAWTTYGWAKYAHASIGIDRWGESAPAEKIYEYLGVTRDAVVCKSKKLVAHFHGKAVPDRILQL